MTKPDGAKSQKQRVAGPKSKNSVASKPRYVKPQIDVHQKPLSKQELRERKRARKGKLYACNMGDVLQIYEQVRYKNCKNRVELLQREIELLSRNLVSAAISRTESRILYLVFYYGSAEQKKLVFDGVRNSLLDISREKYGRHLAIAALTQPGADVEKFIMEHMLPILPKLCGQIYSLEVVTNIAVNSRKFEHGFLQALFDTPQQIGGIVAIACSKNLLGSAFIHKVLKQHIQNIVGDKYEPKGNTEKITPELAIQQLSDYLEPSNFLYLISSPEGVYCAAYLFYFYSAKQKQKILNEAKPRLADMLKDQIDRHFIAYAMLNTDDTRFISEFLGEAIKGNCGDFCQFVLLSGLEALRSGHFSWNAALTKYLYTEIADRNKKPFETRFAEVKKYFEPSFERMYIKNMDHTRYLIKERFENFVVLECIGGAEVVNLFCSLEGDDPLFKHDVAHYALKQYLKRSGTKEIAGLFISKFETMAPEVFSRRGCNVLMMLEALDKDATHAFVRAHLRDSTEKWVYYILQY